MSDCEGEHGLKKRKDEEEWGDDVSILSRKEGPSPTVVIFKMILALTLIGLCSGALVYSIVTSERKQSEEYEPTDYFPIFTNQESPSGTLTRTYRTSPPNVEQQYEVDSYSATWAQDNTTKRIYHRVGLSSRDWQYTWYVFETAAFYQTRKNCTKMSNMNYSNFIEKMGLTYIFRSKTEEMLINENYQEVIVYEGEPPQDSGDASVPPSLVRGYANSDAPITYSWELYYPRLPGNRSLYKEEYYFPDMVNKEPSYGLFDNMPDECLNQ